MPCPVGGRMPRFGKLGEVRESELESHLAYRCSFGGRAGTGGGFGELSENWTSRQEVLKHLKTTKFSMEMSTFPITKSNFKIVAVQKGPIFF